MPESAIHAYITSLIRHFEDLRDGTHGGSASRKDKEAHFEKATGIMEPAWPEYKSMIGGVWSDQNPASGHGQRHMFLVKISDVHNPITAGLPETFETDDELYHNMHMSEGVHILATAYDDLKYEFPQQEKPANPATNWPHLDSNPTGKNEPMLWTVNYGR